MLGSLSEEATVGTGEFDCEWDWECGWGCGCERVSMKLSAMDRGVMFGVTEGDSD